METGRRVRIIIEVDPRAPLDYLTYFVNFLKNFRYVEDAYLDAKAKP